MHFLHLAGLTPGNFLLPAIPLSPDNPGRAMETYDMAMPWPVLSVRTADFPPDSRQRTNGMLLLR